MLFVYVTQMNKRVYLCNTILVTEIFCYRYSTFNNFGKNNIFQRNLAITSGIYWGRSVRNFIQIRSDLTFL